MRFQAPSTSNSEEHQSMSSFSRKSCRKWNDKYLTSNSVAFVFILIEQDEWNAAFRSYGGNGQWSNCHPLTKNVKKEDKDSASNINCGPRAGSRQPIRRSHHYGSPDDTPSIYAVNNRRKNSQFECLPLPRIQSNTVWSPNQWKRLH